MASTRAQVFHERLGSEDELCACEQTRMCVNFVILASYLTQQSNGGRMNPVSLTLDVTLEDLYEARVKQITFTTLDGLGNPRRKKVRTCLRNHRDKYVYPAQGDESPFVNMKPGDVVVTLNVLPHPTFQIDQVLSRNDLFTTLPVNLYDFYYGARLRLDLPNSDAFPSRTRYIDYDQTAAQRRQVVLPGDGLPGDAFAAPSSDGSDVVDTDADIETTQTKAARNRRGDVYVYFDIVLPSLSKAKLDSFFTRFMMRFLFVDTLFRRKEREKK